MKPIAQPLSYSALPMLKIITNSPSVFQHFFFNTKKKFPFFSFLLFTQNILKLTANDYIINRLFLLRRHSFETQPSEAHATLRNTRKLRPALSRSRSEYRFDPLSQHIGAPCRPLVRSGITVCEVRFRRCHPVSVARFHSSVSGKVIAIDSRNNAQSIPVRT